MEAEIGRGELTRMRVVEAASKAMRIVGPDAVSVASVMKGIGLSHGGFYARFTSKDDLVASAYQEMFASRERMLMALVEGKPKPEALRTYINLYLSEGHRDNPGNGCPLAMLSSETPRMNIDVRRAFDAGISKLRAILRPLLSKKGVDADTLTFSLINEMAGALALSRAVSSPTLSRAILKSARLTACNKVGLPTSPRRSKT